MTATQLLLVEREAHTRRLLKVSLEQAGYRVTTVRDGADALSKLELSAPELVIAATDLPQLDGYALVRRMKANSEWARIPVIFMIAGESMEDKIRGLELGVDEYLSKPIFVRELLSRVQMLLAKRVRQDLSESAARSRVAGSLADMTPIDLIESLVSGEQSGVLRLKSRSRAGEVFFEAGEIIAAKVRRLTGEEAVYRVIGWAEGSWEVELGPPECERNVEEATRVVIDTGVRHAGAYNRLLAEVPPLGKVVRVDQEELAARTSEVPAELHGVLSLFDGERTINDIIDDSPFDDLSTLETMARLHAEGLLAAVRGRMHTEPYLDDSAPADASQPGKPGGEEEDEEIYHLETTRPPAVDMPMPEPAAAEQSAPSSPVDPRQWTEDMREDAPQASPAAVEPVAAAADGVESSTPATRQRFKQTKVAGSHSRDALVSDDHAAVAAGDEEPVEQRAEAGPVDGGDPEVGEAHAPSTARRRAVPAAAADDGERETVVIEPEPEPTPESGSQGEPFFPPAAESQPGLSATVRSRRAAQSAMSEESEGVDSEPPASDDEGADRGRSAPSGPGRGADSGAGLSGPSSGPSPLSASGISAQFFRSRPEPEEELPPSSEQEPVYLTDEQIARKERSKRIVAIVVGLLVAIVVYVGVFRNPGGRGLTGGTTTPTSTARSEVGGGSTAAATGPSAAIATTSSAAGGAGSAGGAAAVGGAASGGGPAEGVGGGRDFEGVGGAVPEVPDPLTKAAAKLNVGDYKATIPLAKAAIAANPDNGDAYYYLALAYESLGKVEKARDVYDACVARATEGQYLGWCRRGARKKK